MEQKRERIIVPTPALSEVLVHANDAVASYLEVLNNTSRFRIAPFDQRAAIELAAITREGPLGQSLRVGASSTRTSLKFDRQIVAIARVEGETTIYSDDTDMGKLGESLNFKSDQDLRPADSTGRADTVFVIPPQGPVAWPLSVCEPPHLSSGGGGRGPFGQGTEQPIQTCGELKKTEWMRNAARSGVESFEVKHPGSSIEIPEGNATLWRYMDLAKLLALVSNRGLFFSAVNKLGDRFEGQWSDRTLELIGERDELWIGDRGCHVVIEDRRQDQRLELRRADPDWSVGETISHWESDDSPGSFAWGDIR